MRQKSGTPQEPAEKVLKIPVQRQRLDRWAAVLPASAVVGHSRHADLADRVRDHHALRLQNLNPGSGSGQALPQFRDDLLWLETVPDRACSRTANPQS